VRGYFADLRGGLRIICSRRFWRDFGAFWSGDAIAARMDDWISRFRENTGMEPDLEVERRRAERQRTSEEQDDASADAAGDGP